MKPAHQIFLALGSNLGDRHGSLKKALERLAPYVSVTERSPIFETLAAYVTDQPKFLNAVIGGTTSLDPLALLYTVKEVERQVGRTPTFRYGPRVVDIDILFYDQEKISTAELVVPHPRLCERSFVLRPLVAIAPSFVHPEKGQSVSELLTELAPPEDMVQTELVL